MKTALLACALLAYANVAHADEGRFLAADIVTKTGSSDSVDKVLGLMRTNLIQMVETRCGKGEQDAASIIDQIVMPSVRRSVPMIEAATIEIYVRTYSLEDLRGLDAFYGTTVGQHVLAKQPQIAAAMVPAMMTIVQAQLAQVLQLKAQELQQRGVKL
jgi:hypothetical protein